MGHQRVSGFPEKRADLWGGPVASGRSGELRGTSGNSGKLPANLRIALKIHSEGSSGKSLGNFGGSPGKCTELFPEALGLA